MKIAELQKKQGNKCYYCGELMTTRASRKKRKRTKKKKPHSVRPTDATREHLYTKMDIRRLIDNPIVGAHYLCNQQKAREYEKIVYLEYNYSNHPNLLINLII